MAYDFQPTTEKFEDELSDGVVRFRDRFIAVAADEGINQEEIPNLPNPEIERLSLVTWERLTAEGLEPDGLDAAEAILEITNPTTI